MINLITKFLQLFYFDRRELSIIDNVVTEVISTEPLDSTDYVVYLYVMHCARNYSQKNVLKLGYAKNVEEHISHHLSKDAKISMHRCYKVPMLKSEAVAFKALMRQTISSYSIRTKSSFPGKTDWYYAAAGKVIREYLEGRENEFEDLDWFILDTLHGSINFVKRGL